MKPPWTPFSPKPPGLRSAGPSSGRAYEEDLAELAETLEGQGQAIKDRDYAGYLQLDCDFHRRVAVATGNELLADIITNLNTQVQRFLILARNLPEKAPKGFHYLADCVRLMRLSPVLLLKASSMSRVERPRAYRTY
ncbi:FCD domain-containing protein [Gelria sp. Kuro-4]|uniref:FCD domain-containing protein n=1 Tax=Gelria sp. Kuro-4 TaxID=2796927 RepID=UPI001BEE9320|nr:hypothetical protein kuro4_09350 [Gelria sp. Kuro-4]